MGEHAVRYTPDDGSHYVDVCPLCQDVALEHGWLREGSPMTPTVPYEPRRRRKSWSALLGGRRAEQAPVADEPILRRLSPRELEQVVAVRLALTQQQEESSDLKALDPPTSSVPSATSIHM